MKTLVLRRALVAATTAAVAASVAGCSAAPDPTGGLAIVMGARNNTPPPALGGAAAQARQAALNAQSLLSVVVADGEPYQAEGGVLRTPGKNPTLRQQQRGRNRMAVDQSIRAARAKTAETDLLTAIGLGARSIESQPGPHTIVVVDSGLSTSGQLNFTRPGMLEADPQEVADYLAKADELPDLSSDDVVFQGLGDVAAPQQKLDEADRRNVIAIWRAVAKAAHARSVTVEETPLQGNPPADLPSVTPVPVPPSVVCAGDTVVLTAGAVPFKPDTAELVDPAAAAEILKPIAAKMANGGLRAKLTGTTANVGPMAGQRALSEQRARTVMALLASLEVRVDRMTAIGLGSDFDGYVEDHDSAGNLIPWAAAANRQVIIQLIGEQATC